MERLLIAAAVVVVAVAVSLLLGRRRRVEPPTQPTAYAVPVQLDRDDFDGGDKPWLLVLFTSAICDSCSRAVERAAVLASREVAYQEIPYQDRKDLHNRYGIEAVPTTLLAGSDGVVHVQFVGVPTATDLWAAVAEAREPGTIPTHDLGGGVGQKP